MSGCCCGDLVVYKCVKPNLWQVRESWGTHGKSCISSSSVKFKALQCPQNSVICDNGWTEIDVLNVGVAWWNPQILMAYLRFIALHPEF